MMDRRKVTLLAILCILAAGSSLFFYSAPPPRSSHGPDSQPPLRNVAGEQPHAAFKSSWPQWGGAFSSAGRDGKGFFDRAQARAFSASIPKEFSRYIVDLNARAFLPIGDAASVEQVLAGRNENQAVTVYAQFTDHPAKQQRRDMKDAGIEVLSFVTGYAWTVRGTPAALRAMAGKDFVRGIAAIDARDKMHADVFAGATPQYTLLPDGNTRFMLLTRRDATFGEISRQASANPALAKAAVTQVATSVLGPRFEIDAPAAAAAEIASLDSAAFLEHIPPPVESRDAKTDIESNIADVRDNNPPGLDGSGVTVAVREIGKMNAHVDFATRLQFIDTNGDTGQSSSNHATAVTGQIGSNGSNQPTAKGVAPNVNMLAYALSGDTFLTQDIVNAASKGARVSNHSYGPSGLSTWGDYRSISADWDSALAANNLIGAFAGNEEKGGQFKHIDHFVGAKNTICVSASSNTARAGNDNPPIPKADGIASFSEFGPMNDGRIKPDLVAYGDNVVLDQGANAIQNNSGTSFSTPVVTGAAALVFQQYKKVVGTEPSAALAKALLCNTATDLGPPGPDATYGFGILNVKAAINTINQRQSIATSPFFEGNLSNGGAVNFSVNVTAALPQLKITLCWMDPAGNPVAAKALVNDLDMQVTGPDGTIFFPFSLDPNKPGNPATAAGANSTDPIEQTVVNNPMPGTYTVTIKGTSIPSGDQTFAVCSNQPTGSGDLTATIIASPTFGPVPLDVSFSGLTSNANLSFSWTFGDGSTGGGVLTAHTYTAPGTYNVKLIVGDGTGKTASTSTIIIATKRTVQAFPSKATATLNFQKPENDKMTFGVVITELVLTPEQSRNAIRDGTFEGKNVIVRVGGSNFINAPLNKKAMFKDRSTSVKITPVKGRVDVTLNRVNLADLFAQFGMTSDPASTGQHMLPVEIETNEALYRANFNLLYKPKARSATAKSQ